MIYRFILPLYWIPLNCVYNSDFTLCLTKREYGLWVIITAHPNAATL